MHPTGSHARSSDVILRSYYAYSWHINPWLAGDLERYLPQYKTLMSNNKFPKIISDLPIADIPIEGLSAFLFQGTNQQIIFMEFDEGITVREHSHVALFFAI